MQGKRHSNISDQSRSSRLAFSRRGSGIRYIPCRRVKPRPSGIFLSRVSGTRQPPPCITHFVWRSQRKNMNRILRQILWNATSSVRTWWHRVRSSFSVECAGARLAFRILRVSSRYTLQISRAHLHWMWSLHDPRSAGCILFPFPPSTRWMPFTL